MIWNERESLIEIIFFVKHQMRVGVREGNGMKNLKAHRSNIYV